MAIGRRSDGEKPPEEENERIVAVSYGWVKDWERGSRGEVDMWKFAEQEVERRRAISESNG